MILREDKHSKYFSTNRHKQVGYEFDHKDNFVDYFCGDLIFGYSNNLKLNYNGFFVIKKFNSYSSKTCAEFSFRRSSYYVAP